MKFPFISDAQIDAAALRLKIEALPAAKLHAVPVDLETIVFDYLCDRDELVVELERELPDENGDEVLGKTTIRPGRIQINARLRPDSGRFRFTLAHEIGHWILHRPLLLAAADQPGLFPETTEGNILTTINRSLTDTRPPREEIQANRFAATLLIDHDILRREIQTRVGREGPSSALRSAGALNLPPRGQARFLAAFGTPPNLAQVFAVSVEAMAVAIESRKYLPSAGTLFDH